MGRGAAYFLPFVSFIAVVISFDMVLLRVLMMAVVLLFSRSSGRRGRVQWFVDVVTTYWS